MEVFYGRSEILFKEYSLEVMAELPQTKVADSQPSPGACRPEGLGKVENNHASGGKV